VIVRPSVRSPWHRETLPRWAWAGLLLLRFLGVVLAMLPVATAVLAIRWWTHPPDPTLALLARRGFTATVLRAPAPALGARIERWSIVTTRGDTLRALFRGALRATIAAGEARPWGVVMLGGIGTGDRAALLLPDSLSVDALAMDWPWHGPRRMSWLDFARRLPQIREALHAAPAALAHGAAALRRERSPTRVAVLGASLGSPAAIAALRLTPVEAVIVVDGMADLHAVLESELQRALPHRWLDVLAAPPLAAVGARLLHAVEPARHAAAAERVPALLIDAEAEARYPRESVRALHAVLPHALRLTHAGGHLRPEDVSQVQQIIPQVSDWLSRQRDPLAAAAQAGDASAPVGAPEAPRRAAANR